MKQLAVNQAASTLHTNPQAYRLIPEGPYEVKWISPTELEIHSEALLSLPTDFQTGGTPDIRDCIFSYRFDLTQEPDVKDLRLISLKKSPLTY